MSTIIDQIYVIGGQALKKNTKLYLFLSFLISYISFGIIVFSKIIFNEIFKSPLYFSLFILGCLGPFISTIIVKGINKDELKFVKSKSMILIPIFLIAHYGFNILLKNVYRYGSLLDFFKFLPIMLILFGLQEIGWRGIVQPAFEKEKGFIKSCIITGIFWGIWFLPLIFIPQFIVLPQFYTQFVAYLVGIGILLSSLYKSSKNILNCIILSSLIFALAPVIVLKQGFMLIGIAVIDAIFAGTLKDKKF